MGNKNVKRTNIPKRLIIYLPKTDIYDEMYIHFNATTDSERNTVKNWFRFCNKTQRDNFKNLKFVKFGENGEVREFVKFGDDF